MEDGKFKASFIGGLDRDTSKENYQQNKIFDAFNFRISLDEDSNYLGRLINEKGNSLITRLNKITRIDVIQLISAIIPSTVLKITFVVDGVTYTIDSTDNASAHPNIFPYGDVRYVGEWIKQVVDQSPEGISGFIAFEFNGEDGIAYSKLDKDVTYFDAQYYVSSSPTGNYACLGDVYYSHKYIGGSSIRNKIIMFSTDEDNDQAEPNGTDGAIWTYEFDKSTKEILSKELRFYNKSANFSRNNPVKAISIHENDLNEKTYWIDGYNNLRFFNLTRGNVITEPSNLELAPYIDFGNIVLKSKSSSGNFLSGVVQYGYQLYNKYGNQTVLSPLSDLYSIKDANSLGGDVNEYVSCSLNIEIQNLDSSFTSIKVFRFHYSQPGVSPSVTLIDDFQFGSGDVYGSTTYSFNDDGSNYLGAISLEEALLLGSTNFKPEDISSKHNMLFAAGIETKDFDIEYDARAYSFMQDSNVLKLYEKDNSVIELNVTSSSVYDQVPKTSDAINPEYWDVLNKVENKGIFKYWHNEYYDAGTILTPANYRFFKINSKRLGGSGKNVSYEFVTAKDESEDLVINISGTTDESDWFRAEASSIPRINGGPANGEKNYNNPYYLDWRGYQRGEIYRFAVIFVNKEGRVSFAKWIADIKIPEHFFRNDEFTPANNPTTAMYYFDTSTKETKVNPYWIKFDINITQEMIDSGVVGYKVVRAERTNYDKTIVSQGYVTNVVNLKDQVGSDYPYYSKLAFLQNSAFTNGQPIAKVGTGGPSWNLMFKHGSDGLDAPLDTGQVYVSPQANEAALGKIGLLWKFFSPDVNYNKDLNYEENSWLHVIGCARRNQASPRPDNEYVYYSKYLEFRRTFFNASSVSLDISNMVMAESPLDKDEAHVKITSMDNNDFVFNYCPDRVKDIADGNLKITSGGYGSTCLDLRLSQYPDFVNAFAWENNGLNDQSGGSTLNPDDLDNEGRGESGPVIANIRKVTSSQYGGIDYNNRLRTKYIDATEFIPCNSSGVYNTVVKRGDTFIGFFKNLNLMRGSGNNFANFDTDPTYNGFNNGEFVAIPMEMTINVGAQSNKDPWTGLSQSHLRETEDQTNANTIIINSAVGAPAYGVSSEDQYNLNKTYNNQQNLVKSTERPSNFESVTNRDVETRFSDVKQYNELIDGWTIFRPNNINNVDSRFGKIKAIQFFRNELYFFQENAYGIWQVNQQALIGAQDGSQIQLGVGGVLARFDYISKINGIQSKFAIASGDEQVLFYDQQRNKIIRANSLPNEVSVISGMNSYLEQFFTNPNYRLEKQNPLSDQYSLFYYDNDEKEFLMTFKIFTGQYIPDGIGGQIALTSNHTLSFSEKLNEFGPRYGYYPGIYVGLEGQTFSVNNDFNKIYIHKKEFNNRCVYYDNQAQISTVTFILNPVPGSNGVFIFDSLVYLFDVKLWNELTSSYEDVFGEGISGLRVYNDYQDTGYIDLSTSSIHRVRQRFRKWRVSIPRQEGTLNRMRDTHAFVELTYVNRFTEGENESRRVALSNIFYNARLSGI